MSLLDFQPEGGNDWEDTNPRKLAMYDGPTLYEAAKTEYQYQSSEGRSLLAKRVGSDLSKHLNDEQQAWIATRVRAKLKPEREREPMEMSGTEDRGVDYAQMYADILAEEGSPMSPADFTTLMHEELKRANEAVGIAAEASGKGTIGQLATQLGAGIEAGLGDPAYNEVMALGLALGPAAAASGAMAGGLATASEAVLGAIVTGSFQNDVIELYKEAGIADQYTLTDAAIAVAGELVIPAAVTGAGYALGKWLKMAPSTSSATQKAVSEVSDTTDKAIAIKNATDATPEVRAKAEKTADVGRDGIKTYGVPADETVLPPNGTAIQTEKLSDAILMGKSDEGPKPSQAELAATNKTVVPEVTVGQGRAFDGGTFKQSEAKSTIAEAIRAKAIEDIERQLKLLGAPNAVPERPIKDILDEALAKVEGNKAEVNVDGDVYRIARKETKGGKTRLEYQKNGKRIAKAKLGTQQDTDAFIATNLQTTLDALREPDGIDKALADIKAKLETDLPPARKEILQDLEAELNAIVKDGVPVKYQAPLNNAVREAKDIHDYRQNVGAEAADAALARANNVLKENGLDIKPEEPTLPVREADDISLEEREALEYLRDNPDEDVFDVDEFDNETSWSASELNDEWDMLDELERANNQCL